MSLRSSLPGRPRSIGRLASLTSLLVLTGLLVAGCASLRGGSDAHPAVGEWSYVVEDTPSGDSEGTITIQSGEDGLSGEIHSALLGQTVPLEVVNLSEEAITVQATFNVQGQNLQTTTNASLAPSGQAMTGETEIPGYGTYDFEAEKVSASNR